MQKEYKSFPVEFKEIQPVENYFTFKGYSSVFGNVDFGPRDLSIREHSIKPTAISAGNTDQADIFAVAETSPQDVADSDDWLNG